MATAIFTSAEEIALEIKARLQMVRRANGYETDIGAAVFLGKRHLDKSHAPCVSILEGDDVVNPFGVGTECDIAQGYVLVALVPCDEDNPNVAAHQALRDMKRAMWNTNGVADRDFGKKVRKLRYLGRQIAPRDPGQKLVTALLEFGVEFAEKLSNP